MRPGRNIPDTIQIDILSTESARETIKNSSDETWTKLDSLNAFACESRCIFYVWYNL